MNKDLLETLPTIQPESTVSKKLSTDEDIRVVGFAMAKGQELTTHTSVMDGRLLVVDGETDVEVGGTRYHLEAGDTVDLPANIPHAVAALTDLRFLLELQNAE